MTVENYLERDSRLDGWSVHGLGAFSHPTDAWVQMFLSIKPSEALPAYLQDMFDRAQGSMVYGCFYYPLFTLGIEELFRFSESALREAVKETGALKSVQKMKYAPLIDWAHDNDLLTDSMHGRWHAGRSLRNSTSHKDSSLLLGPNDAAGLLSTTAELTDTLFRVVRETSETP
ncbi:hypothetical protein [Ruegeria arenilitoris]|uniref:hypothetical protein n=1 Tax=Ruegeria arenilitoris TaxID=1173585 RepID=UPI00147C2372|nr:hypothetical protein [Ruegeria arenilitoris]